MGLFEKTPTENEIKAFKDAATHFNSIRVNENESLSVYQVKVSIKAFLGDKGYTPSECEYAVDKIFN